MQYFSVCRRCQIIQTHFTKLTLCGLTGRKNSPRGGRGLSGLVHEVAHPSISYEVSIHRASPDVDTVCLFKTRLDKFWMHQDVMYDFAADLTGIGDRSVREIS